MDEPTDDEVWAAAEQANAAEFIREFPQGLHTSVGERGVKLSGGQKQRLAICRAIIRKPSILLLDEATSSLDPASEKVVQKALDSLLGEHHRGAAICVAHRLTTIMNCDNIIFMHEGKKVEEGSHSELLSLTTARDKENNVTAGFYRFQWESQMEDKSASGPSDMTDAQLGAKTSSVDDAIKKLQKEREELLKEQSKRTGKEERQAREQYEQAQEQAARAAEEERQAREQEEERQDEVKSA
eukprot:COSAG06_NODE_688_length_13072_cov_15.012719_10_plen_241_part_00